MADVKLLLAAYREAAQTMEELIRDVQAAITAGKPPSEQCGAEFNRALEVMQENYAAIRAEAETAAPDHGEIAGLPVQDYIQMIDRGRARRERAMETLSRFVRVAASSDAYAQALAPFQAEAAARLERLRAEPDAKPDGLEGPELILAALALESLDSGEGEELLERITALYPPKVYHGIFFRKYAVGEEEQREEGTEEDAGPKAGENCAPTAEEPGQKPEPEPEAKSEPAAELEAKPEPAAEPEPVSKMVKAVNKIKTMQGSASVIKNDMRQLPLAAKFILPLFTCVGAVTLEQGMELSRLLDTDEIGVDEQAESHTLERLMAKNYVAAYDPDKTGRLVYCLTAFGWKCMTKETVARSQDLWLIPYGKVKLCGEREMERARLMAFVENNELLIGCLRWGRSTLETAEYDDVMLNSVCWRAGRYSVLLPGEETPRRILPAKEPFEGETSVLIFCDESEPLPEFLPEGVDARCIQGGQLLKPKEAPRQEDGADQPEDAPENGEEAENVSEEPEDAPESVEEAEILPEEPEDAQEGEEEAENAAEEPEDDLEDELEDPESPSAPHSTLITQPEDLTVYGIGPECDARDYAARLWEHDLSPDHCVAYRDLLDLLIREGRVRDQDDVVENSLAQAVILSKALAIYNPAYQEDFARLVLAMDSPIQEHHYTARSISSLFEQGAGEGFPSMKLMALLRALFAPDMAYDYDLLNYARSLLIDFEANFPGLTLLKPLYNLLLQVNDLSDGGFTAQVLHTFGSEEAQRDVLRKAMNSARELIPEPRISSGLKAMVPMLSRCFGQKSNLCACMEIIAADKREERELVEAVYQRFCGKESGLSAQQIDSFYEENWSWASEKIRAPRDVFPVLRQKVIDQIRARLNVMEHWLQLTEDSDAKKQRAEQLSSLRSRILAEMGRILSLLEEECAPGDRAVLRAGILRLQGKLEGRLMEEGGEFADFLRTGIFALDDAGIPCVDEYFSSYRYYEPWRNALRHIMEPVRGLREVLERVSDPADELLYDNIGQAVAICRYLKSRGMDGCSEKRYIADAEAIRRTAKGNIEQFKGELESAFAYGRLADESVKEDILEVLKYAWDQFDGSRYYGCLRTLLNAQRRIIEDATEARLQELQQDIDDRLKNASPRLEPILRMARAKLEEPDRNFVVAEEYINRYDAGVADEMDTTLVSVENPFLDFVGGAYKELYELCMVNSSGSLRGFGADYVERKLRDRKVSAQYQESSRALLRSIPNQPIEAEGGRITVVLRELGFDVVKVTGTSSPGSGGSMAHLLAEIRPDPKDKAEYAHPVNIMGTKLQSPVDVICFFGRMQPNDIVDKVCRLELNRTAIVFLNGTLDLPGRRQIAERFHKDKSGQNPFLLIDWVLLLYLALRQKTERLPVLLNCSLPYTSSFQPFVIKGSVPDEMFIGRKQELNQILDPNGPVIVYGGRQLGKTALLERALSLSNHPKKREFAVLVRAGELFTEEALVSAIVQELNEDGLAVPPVKAMRELCKELRRGYQEKKWYKLRLLIDEVDAVLEAFRGMKPAYRPILSLSDLSRDTGSDFKFVFAGLHNVCRAANDPNTVFGQFGGALCIRPLSAADSLELLSRPLRYLGFDIDAARLEHILVNTSFYPGIVHYVGYCLVQNLSNSYANYYSASRRNPPYDLTEKQLGEITNSSALNERINERIRWTLEVDPRYFMLARCITYLYYDYPEANKTGHSVDMIQEYAELLEISCLSGLDREECMGLLLELVDMGILVRPTEETFRLRQRRFQTAIGGSREKIEQDIRREEAAHGRR